MTVFSIPFFIVKDATAILEAIHMENVARDELFEEALTLYCY